MSHFVAPNIHTFAPGNICIYPLPLCLPTLFVPPFFVFHLVVLGERPFSHSRPVLSIYVPSLVQARRSFALQCLEMSNAMPRTFFFITLPSLHQRLATAFLDKLICTNFAVHALTKERSVLFTFVVCLLHTFPS